ncbi:MAG: aldose 1-epimerase family protein [Selenomonadaceae bacterium]|uniref:Aldose 1-epimerase family protein n=1 Tax=Anaerovibrio slackiae TaxID=2652309 RepID=A0A6I2U8W8_9FIRM|nr:aldose 1-epimerase family protein [Anaerovibrio slackiae]MBQ2410074.1 aldose 1-epimerase family protein [Selenomonadaceae bacterium]MBQ5651049.1 aldose 1-epimerase family protein [Selenomonadaceae bacterium]MBQ5822144.1 aldose 1-epimerase family protein [Selenomonadaceae bacterium]MBQ5846145.1 aldose 1-epimerase family protein [Selenomonadaceae bacterium]MBR0328643.1 aldose 1-epimerase family protein [Selenomonadaceae bacterium]
MYTLENEFLRIKVREHGGELREVLDRQDGTQYLWDGNPEYWQYSSPVLFPIVGRVKNNKYRYQGQEYEIPSHGIGRISEYKLAGQTENSITMALDYDEETLKVYPFKFRLEITYRLEGKSVAVHWKVINADEKEMYFSIGAHPALRCPIGGEGRFEDCYLDFPREEASGAYDLAPGCLLKHTKQDFLQGRTLPLNYDLFREDARIVDDLRSDTIMVRSAKTSKAVGIRAAGFPYWGIWSPSQGGAPFICLEPWHGHADYDDFEGEISEKEGIISLAAGKSFEAEYSIVIEG